MAFTVNIDGVNRTSKVVAYSLNIQNILTNRRDNAYFNIRLGGTDTYIPTMGNEVVIYNGATKIFAGVITVIEIGSPVLGMQECRIECQDYTRLLDRRLVPDIFENMTVNQIIASLREDYFPEFSIASVDAPVEIKYISFKYKPVAKCIEELANLINYDWYVDYDKVLHFFAKEVEVAPFSITDSNGNMVNDSLIIRRDNSQVRNSIIVRGGQYIASQTTFDLQTNGVDYVFPLPYRFADFGAHLTGEILSVGIDNINSPDDYDALYNFQEKIIRFKAADKPSSGKTLKVSGKPYLPVIIRYKSPTHIAAMASAESNPTFTSDGVYEYLIEDKSINSKEGARQRARAEILAYAQTLSEGEFVTYTDGLSAGQKITITSASRGIDEDFIINKVQISQFGPNQLQYNVSLITTRTFDLIDILQRLLLENTKKIEIDPNEVVDILFDFNDSAAFTDSLTAPTTTTGPYHWSSNPSTPPTPLIWGFGTWN